MSSSTIDDWGFPMQALGRLPRICSNARQLREMSDEALAALQLGNEPPTLFARSGSMVAVVRNEKQQQIITNVSEAALRGRLARSADYFRSTHAGNEYDCPPPIDVVRDILALEPSLWQFCPLEGVVEAPIIRPDGTILDRPGYDPATLLYYAPDPTLTVPPIPEQPSEEDIVNSRELLDQAIGEFPFVDEASKANAIALMLTTILKPAMNAPSPMALLDAPQAGTGKSLLADQVAIVATGRPGEMSSAPRDEDEWRKQITTALMGGSSVVIIDNISRPLDNPDLCKLLTETTHCDRAMRTHDKLVLPVKSTWIATGNNIQLGGDMPRRCYWIRMDAKVSRPFTRDNFKIEDLKAWTSARRGDLLAALLTLARVWYAAGRPKPGLKRLGSYENWSTTIGGILEHVGIPGFLANAEAFYRDSDPEAAQWEVFLQTLYDVFDGEPFTVAKIFEKLKMTAWNGTSNKPTTEALRLRESLPDFIAESVDRDGFFQKRTGRCFGDRVDRRFGEFQLHLKRDTTLHGCQQWKVIFPGK
ncbi:MAG: hypothetical protein ACJ746_22610 [Bryobacteraceae bacterium]